MNTPLPAPEVDSFALFWAASSHCTGLPPSNTICMPSKMTIWPWPPASTTPAFFRTGSWLGVFSSARWPALITSFHSSTTSAMPLAAASSLATRATVSMVPSVGFITAL